jgi:hypothetical protein
MAGKSRARQIVEEELREAAQIALGTVQSRYFKAFDRRANGLALLGHTNEEIAELFGVERNTFAKWVIENPSLKAALHKARFDDNIAVVRALHRAARGYKHRETKLNVVDGELIKTNVTKAYPPNVNASMVILANRAGTQWKDKRTVEHSGSVNLSHLVESSLGELAKPVDAKLIEQASSSEPDDDTPASGK